MARAHTPQEQLKIRAVLLTTAQLRFEEVGLHKVTIAELTKAAGIGKGSFYLHFSSKEALFFTIQENLEAQFKADVVARLIPFEDDPSALIEQFILLHLRALGVRPFLMHLTDPGVIEALQDKLPAAVLVAHQASDKAFYTNLVRTWIERGVLPADTDPGAIFSVLAATFALAVSKQLVGDRWEDVVGLLARALARELTTT